MSDAWDRIQSSPNFESFECTKDVRFYIDISDYDGPISNDTFELRSINGIPIFVGEEWRNAPNGSKSIAEWVYETNKPVTPICYFKARSQISELG